MLIDFDRFWYTQFLKSGWCLAGATFLSESVFFSDCSLYVTIFTIFQYVLLYSSILKYISLGDFAPQTPHCTLDDYIYFYTFDVFGPRTLTNRSGSIYKVILHSVSSNLDLMVPSYGHCCI